MGRVVAGRYELVRVIGEGGMGTVHEARHTTTLKRCALKLIDQKITKMPGASERFLREARAPAAIDHPGIAEVLDGGTDEDGALFLVMELLEGTSFEDLLGDDARPLRQRLMLLEQMLEPLAAAHARGFVHRDLKPDNVFVVKDREGRERVKLIDFGIARQMGASRLTDTGVPMGTVYYMSPEQARSAREAQPTSDVWSFGVMLYEVLAGEMPFDGETVADILVKICTEEPPDLLSRRPDAPPALVRLTERCMHKDAAERPADARVLMAEMIEARHAAAGALRMPADQAATLDSGVAEVDAPATVVAMHPPISAQHALGPSSSAMDEESEDMGEGRPTLVSAPPPVAGDAAPPATPFADPWSDVSSASIDSLEMSQPFRTSVVYDADEVQRPDSLVPSAAPRARTPAPRPRKPAADATDILPKRPAVPAPSTAAQRRVPIAIGLAAVAVLAGAIMGHFLGWF